MGTTLTGTTPQDTYDSLIKVTDNGPLSGSLKTLTDGLGNDSALALSTGAASVTGTLAVTNSAATVATLNRTTSSGSTLAVQVVGSTVGTLGSDTGGSGIFEIASVAGGVSADTVQISRSGGVTAFFNSAGNVGIGTSSPDAYATRYLQIHATSGNSALRLSNATSGTTKDDGADVEFKGDHLFLSVRETGGYIVFAPEAVERVRVTTDGLTFNGDTAAANALDDYEEGTWTPAVSFGGASVGVTYNFRSGIYQKIGNKVTLNCFISVSDKGTSTGDLVISGFPFALFGATANYCPVTLRPSGISFADQMIGYAEETSTQCFIQEVSSAGAVTGINDANCGTSFSIMMQITYFA